MKHLKKILFVFASITTAQMSFAGSVGTNPEAIVVRRGTATITLGDIDAYLEQHVAPKDRAGYMDSPKRIEGLLLSMLLQQQLANDARALHLEQDKDVERQIALVINELLAHRRLDQATKDLQVPNLEQLAKEKYALQKAEFIERGPVDVKHILISNKSHAPDEAAKLANEIVEEAKKNPDAFDELVEKYSEDKSKKDNAGLIVNAASSQYDKAFAAAASELQKPGDISPPVRSAFGLHVLKLIKRDPDRQKSFEEVHDALISQLTNDFIDQRRRDFRDKFVNEKMDANAELVASLRDRYRNPATAPAPESETKSETEPTMQDN